MHLYFFDSSFPSTATVFQCILTFTCWASQLLWNSLVSVQKPQCNLKVRFSVWVAVAAILAGVVVPTVVLAAVEHKCIFWLWNFSVVAYHLRREDTDWFDKPREGHPRQTDRRQVRFYIPHFFQYVLCSTSHTPRVANVFQMKLVPYACPHIRLKLRRDPKDTRVSG